MTDRPLLPGTAEQESRSLLQALQALRSVMGRIETEEAACLARIHPVHRASARNLLHFIAFHRHAHPGLAGALRQRGLCSLVDCDAHLLASLEAVIAALEALEGRGAPAWGWPSGAPGESARRQDLQEHCDRLFGALARDGAGIMVTLSGEVADRPGLIEDLLNAGMTLARINCAHDDPEVWGRMVAALEQARRATGRPCAIAMDLAGPKLRTGRLAPEPAVIRARPLRDRLGRPTQPARIIVRAPEALSPPAGDDVLLPGRLSSSGRLRRGDRLRGRDASGRWRTLTVAEIASDGLLLVCDRSCHFIAGLVFRQREGSARLVVGPLEPVGGERLLRPGDAVRLTAEPDQGNGSLPCTLPEVFVDLRCGERVLFDDGTVR